MADAITAETCFDLHRPDGAEIAAYRWEGPEPARGVLVLAHGMGEHARRYPRALRRVIDSGFVLFGVDHRGHGANLSRPGAVAGDYGPGGFPAVVDDIAALIELAGAENPGLPVILLGHSMGSFIAQACLLDHGEKLSGAVLVGTTDVERMAAALMHEADIGAALNRDFEPSRTPFDWLSRDEREVDLYISDPLCGFMLTPASMTSLLSQGQRLADPAQIARIPSDLAIKIVVGDADPLGRHLGAIAPLAERYRNTGIEVDVSCYAQGRHEILNETNRDEVVMDLLTWLQGVKLRSQR